MDAPVRAWLKELLDRRFTFRTSCAWPDWIRDKPDFEHTAPWHYQDYVENNVSINADIHDHCNETLGCMLSALKGSISALYTPNIALAKGLRVDQSLGFVGHLVVDAHQPLHVGRKEDLGGNTIDIRWQGKKTNIHRLLDGQLLKGMEDLTEQIIAEAQKYPKIIVKDIDLEIKNWLIESRQIAASKIYPALENKETLDEETAEQIQKVMLERLGLSTVRLEAVLNFAYQQSQR